MTKTETVVNYLNGRISSYVNDKVVDEKNNTYLKPSLSNFEKLAVSKILSVFDLDSEDTNDIDNNIEILEELFGKRDSKNYSQFSVLIRYIRSTLNDEYGNDVIKSHARKAKGESIRVYLNAVVEYSKMIATKIDKHIMLNDNYDGKEEVSKTSVKISKKSNKKGNKDTIFSSITDEGGNELIPAFEKKEKSIIKSNKIKKVSPQLRVSIRFDDLSENMKSNVSKLLGYDDYNVLLQENSNIKFLTLAQLDTCCLSHL